MRKLWLRLAGIVLGFLSPFSSRAQAPIDYLTPVEGYFSSYTPLHDYHSAVRDVLQADLSAYPLVRIICLPSLFPEYLLSIEQKKHNDPHYFLICKRAQNNLFSTSSKTEGAQVVVDTKQVEIQPVLALALADLFTTALQRVRYPSVAATQPLTAAQRQRVFEDTTFYFATFPSGLGIRAGQATGTAAGPTVAALLAITRRLQLLTTRSPDPEAQKALLRDVTLVRSQVR